MHDKIDALDIATVVQAVNDVYQGQKHDGVDAETAARNIFTADAEPEEVKTEKVATYINFSGNAGDTT